MAKRSKRSAEATAIFHTGNLNHIRSHRSLSFRIGCSHFPSRSAFAKTELATKSESTYMVSSPSLKTLKMYCTRFSQNSRKTGPSPSRSQNKENTHTHTTQFYYQTTDLMIAGSDTIHPCHPKLYKNVFTPQIQSSQRQDFLSNNHHAYVHIHACILIRTQRRNYPALHCRCPNPDWAPTQLAYGPTIICRNSW